MSALARRLVSITGPITESIKRFLPVFGTSRSERTPRFTPPGTFTPRLEHLEDRRMLSVTLFVDGDAQAGGDGLGWETAYDNIQSALESAAAFNEDQVAENDVDAIWIAEGVYRPTAELEPGDARSASFSLLDGVALYGGFAGTETAPEERDWAAHETVLSGDLGVAGDASDNAYTVVYCGENVTAGLDGVSVTGGNADGDYDRHYPERTHGSGIFNSGTLHVANSTVRDNFARSYGGGIYNTGILTVIGSTFSRNTATFGGAIYSGVIYYDDTLEVTNCEVLGNSAEHGGGIYTTHEATITNTTISGNSATESVGAIAHFGTLTLNNSILWQNAGGELAKPEGITALANLVDIDPGFVRDPSDGGDGWGDDPETPDVDESANDDFGDLRLTAQSPAIGHGDNDSAVDANGNSLATDLDGNFRVYGEAIDCGAFEFQGEVDEDREAALPIVTTSEDVFDLYDDRVSLREAIYYARTASADAAVTFDPSLDGATITLAGRSFWIDQSLVVDASSLTSLTIDADNQSRAFTVLGPDDEEVELNALTITRGLPSFGTTGGGIYNSGTLHFLNTALRESSADTGGGIYSTGTLTVSGSTLSENSADTGGGIYSTGPLTVGNSTLSKNVASSKRGGAIYSSGRLTVAGSAILGNMAFDEGGGISSEGTLTVTDSVLSGNSALDGGGGIYSDGTAAVANSVFAGNGTRDEGGAIYMEGELTVTNSTFAQNSAASCGGISNPRYGAVTLDNSLFWGNRGGDLDVSTGVRASRNLIGIDPEFVRNPSDGGDGWGDNPYTHDVDESANDDFGDLHLTEQSPAIDYGDDAFAVDPGGNPLVSDVDGNPRNYGGSSVDVGGYEFQGDIPIGREDASLTVTTSEDVFDPYDGRISLREAIYYATADVKGAPITFDAALDGATITLAGASLWIDDTVAVDASSLTSLTVDGDDNSRVFTVVATDEHEVELNALTITRGFLDNSGRGAGIYNSSNLVVINSTLSGNSSSSYGGGIDNHGTMEVTNCTLWKNATTGGGGGGISNSGMLTLTNSMLSGNSAFYSGGGLFNFGTMSVVNSTLSGNAANGEYFAEGGGVCNAGDLTLTNSTLSGNSANYSGGGIDHRMRISGRPTTILNNTVVAGNDAPISPDLDRNDATLSGSHNLIGDGSDQSYFVHGQDGNLVGTAQAPIDPRFLRDPMPGPDGEWGTPDDYYGDLRLLPISPTINAGNIALAVDAHGNPLTVDLAGSPRIVGDTVDMGAYEAVEFLPGDLNLDQAVNFADLDLVRANWNRDVFPGSLIDGDPSGDGYVGSADLDIVRGNWGAVPSAGAVDKVFERTLFVDADASAGGNGLGWGTAYDNLQSALECAETLNADGIAENDVDAIWIAEGVYKPSAELEPGDPRSASFSLVHGVTLYGGFEGTESVLEERDWVTHETVLSGDLGVVDNSADNAYTVVYCGQGATAGLDGVTVTRGKADGAYDSGPRGSGGGVYNDGGTLTIANSAVLDNFARRYGGGVYSTGTLEIAHSGLSGNSAYSDGGGIFSSGALTIANGTLAANSAFSGGGILSSGTLTVTNGTFSGNSAGGRGGGILSVGALTITNSTLSGNAAGKEGGGVYSTGIEATCTLANSILAKNTAFSGGDIHQSSGTLTGSHNLIGDGSRQTALAHGIDGNLVGTFANPIDPLFVRAPSDGGDGWADDYRTHEFDESSNNDYGDLRLLPGSPAIDAGDNALAVDADGNPLTVDVAGNPRIVGAAVDMGAYEALEFLPGDLNLDQIVDSADLDLIRANWCRTVSPGSLIDGDASGDGYVGSADLDIVRGNWLRRMSAAVDAVFERTAADDMVGDARSVYGPTREGDIPTMSRPTHPHRFVSAFLRRQCDFTILED